MYSESDEKLLDYISINYGEDGDIDEDFMERIFLDERTDSLKCLLSGCSYEDKVIPEFEKIFVPVEKFNSGLLLYEHDYDGNVTINENKYCRLKFVGIVKIQIKGNYNYDL